MSNRRIERVSKLVKEQISEIILNLSLADCGFITVTAAAISPDLKDGRVYVPLIGKPEHTQRALAALELRHGAIQTELAARIVLKYTPKLHFILDKTEAEAQRIEHLLDELKTDKPELP